MSLSVRVHGYLAVDMKLGCHDSLLFDADLLLYMFCWQRCSFKNISDEWILLKENVFEL